MSEKSTQPGCIGRAALLLFSMFVSCLSPSAHANSAGISWLAGQGSPDGHYGSADGMATSYQATAETLRTFYLLGGTGLSDALAYVNAPSSPQTAEYLSRALIAGTAAGLPASDPVIANRAGTLGARINGR